MSHDRTTTINVHNLHGWELDKEFLAQAMLLCVHGSDRHGGRRPIIGSAVDVDIYPQTPAPTGWLQWHIRVRYGPFTDTYRMTRPCVGEPVEIVPLPGCV